MTRQPRRPRSAARALRVRLLRVVVVAAAGAAVLFAGSATSATGSPPAAAQLRPAGAAEPAWNWPVGVVGQPLRAFEAPATAYAAGHRGVDLAAQPGMPVRSPAGGVVSFVGRVVDRPVLSIRHGDDLISSVEPVTATVVDGERVTAGQVVGVVAMGAHCSGRCVHLGVRRHGQYISPMLFFGGVERAVLLPLAPERIALAQIPAPCPERLGCAALPH
ncbi:MAG: M23 family metallopeptidase [Cryobacterium sp.]